MGDVERRARQVAQEIGADEDKGPQQLREAIKDVCEKAHAYDKKTLKSLGVRPIWVRDNADVSRVLDVVRTGNPEAAN
jgi:hypothetical protein